MRKRMKMTVVIMSVIMMASPVLASANTDFIPVDGQLNHIENKANQSEEGEYLVMFGENADPSVMKEYSNLCENEEGTIIDEEHGEKEILVTSLDKDQLNELSEANDTVVEENVVLYASEKRGRNNKHKKKGAETTKKVNELKNIKS